VKDDSRVISIEFKRNMSSDDVKKSIRTGFKINIPNLTFLEVNNGRLYHLTNNQQEMM